MNPIAFLQFAQIRFDATISLQTIVIALSWIVTVAVYLTVGRKDVEALKKGLEGYSLKTEENEKQINTLTLVAERVTVLLENLTGRVERVENTCDRRHNGN